MKKTAVLLTAAVVLTGCGGGSEPQPFPESSHYPAGAEESSSPVTDSTGEDIVLTIAVLYDLQDPVKELISRFNSEDNGITIQIKDYSKEFEDLGYDEKGVFRGYNDEERKKIDFAVTQDLINKDEADLVGTFSFGNSAKYEIFKRTGAFADLYSFMADDPEVNPDTLNRHILSLNERDGKLCSVPTYYTVQTMIGESQYVGTEQNWTIDEFIDCWNRMPEGSSVCWSTESEGIYYDILRANTTAFIDYANCETHFDAPDFRKLLGFCSQFPSNMGIKNEESINRSAPQLVRSLMLTDYQDSIVREISYDRHEAGYYRLRDGSHTLVGFPTSDRNGAFLCGTNFECSIRADISEERQRAAWRFLRELYTEDFQTGQYAKRIESTDPQTGDSIVQYIFTPGFPVNNAARRNIARSLLAGEYEESGIKLAVQGHEIRELNKLSLDQADIDFLDDYMDSIDRWEFPDTDRELFWIIEDEVLTFLHGEQDIDTTINLIQNRANIWISEQS